MRVPIRLSVLGGALVALTVGVAPLLSSAADHIDASAFGSIGTPGGAFNPVSVNGERDINDIYAFQGANASRTGRSSSRTFLRSGEAGRRRGEAFT